jgi:hypothetical protein
MRRGEWKGLAALLLLAVCGCGKEDADRMSRIAVRTGERLDRVCGGSRGKLSDSWAAARGCWTDTALDGRVATRLRWDKGLSNTSIDVKAGAPGVIRLRGKVTDQATHEHVLNVAATTVGVEKIVDEVSVEGNPSEPAAKP